MSGPEFGRLRTSRNVEAFPWQDQLRRFKALWLLVTNFPHCSPMRFPAELALQQDFTQVLALESSLIKFL